MSSYSSSISARKLENAGSSCSSGEQWRILFSLIASPQLRRRQLRGGALRPAPPHQGGGHRKQPHEVGAGGASGRRQESCWPRRMALAGKIQF